MEGIIRIFAGIAGGFTASASKILALDIEKLGRFVETGSLDDINELRVTIFIFTPVLMAIGGIIAWASMEPNRMKLLALGAAAPALIAPWTSSRLDTIAALESGFVTSAYAQQTTTRTSGSRFTKGVKVLFGLENPANNRYWVIVGSKRKKREAKRYAAAINAADPSLQAFVGQPQPNRNGFPIIVGGQSSYLELGKAQKLKSRAIRMDIIPQNAYLSDYPDRLPAVR